MLGLPDGLIPPETPDSPGGFTAHAPVTDRQRGVSVGHDGPLSMAVVTWRFHSTAGGPPHATDQISGSHSLNQPVRSVHLVAACSKMDRHGGALQDTVCLIDEWRHGA